MRSIVALLFVSAVLSASATAVGQFHDFIDGFVTGLNDAYLNQDILALHDSGDLVNTAIQEVIQAAKTHDIDATLNALEDLFTDIHVFAVDSHNVLLDLENILETFSNSTANFSTNVLLQHISQGANSILNDFSNVTSGNAYSAGYSLADIAKIIALGNGSVPLSQRRSLRKLSEDQVQDVVSISLDVILFLQGFLEQANTTVNITDYETFSNDAGTDLIYGQKVIHDIEKKNFTSLMSNLMQFYQNSQLVLNDVKVLRVEVAAWIERDLALINQPQRLMNAGEAMVMNYNLTKQNIQSMQAAFAQQDFEGAGNALAGLYNEFYTGLSAPLN